MDVVKERHILFLILRVKSDESEGLRLGLENHYLNNKSFLIRRYDRVMSSIESIRTCGI